MTIPLGKPIRRLVEIRGLGYGRQFVVEISRGGIEFREKGRRFRLAVGWPECYRAAAENAAAERRRERIVAAATRRIKSNRRAV